MVDYFIKYGWIVPLKDKTTKIYWVHSKNVLHNIIFWQPCTLIMEQNQQTKKHNKSIWLEGNIQHIFRIPYNLQNQGAEESFKEQLKDF